MIRIAPPILRACESPEDNAMKRIPALTICLLLATALPASATTDVVNSLADTAGTCGSDCTLRQPIA